MSKEIKISLYEVVGSPHCIDLDGGKEVYEHIAPPLAAGWRVVLSFRNVTIITPAFLNAAIGELYGTFSEDQIGNLLKIVDDEENHLPLLKGVVRNAKLYFEDPERFNRVVAEIPEIELSVDEENISKKIKISVFEVVGSPHCVAVADGQKVYIDLALALQAGRRVNLSFLNVTALTPVFLSAAVGQLYDGTFSEDYIRELLKFSDAQPRELRMLESAVDNAKLYFKDRKRFKRAVAEAEDY